MTALQLRRLGVSANLRAGMSLGRISREILTIARASLETNESLLLHGSSQSFHPCQVVTYAP